jgi:hypothetical protein
MAIDREAIASALFATAREAARFATADRRLRHWADVSPPEQPALFMSEKGGDATTESRAFNAPVVHRLSFDLFIYAHSSDPYLSPAMVLNPLVDSVERALSPLYGPAGAVLGYHNLGLDGMVQYVRIHGRVATDEGVLGDQAFAIVPVEILAT